MKLIREEIEDVKILTEAKNGKKSLYIEGSFPTRKHKEP